MTELDNSIELAKKAVEISVVITKELTKVIDDSGLSIGDKLTLEMLSVSSLLAITIRTQYILCRPEVTFDDFQNHCFDAVKIYCNKLTRAGSH